MNSETFRDLCLSFLQVEERPHFDRRAFRVSGKKIFATLHEKSLTANLKLTPADQEQFSERVPKGIYPVPNKWGVQGWTTFELSAVPDDVLLAALETAYNETLQTKK